MGWEFVKLGDLVHRKIGYGIVQPGANVDVGVPVIKVNNIISGLSNIELLEKTTTDIDARYTRTRLVGGELVISLVGSVGKTAIVPKTFAGCNLVRATGLIDIKDEILAKWVKYYIDSPLGQAYINSNVNTTVQVTLNIKSLVDMPIPLPEPSIREKIVAILSSIDDKIELNSRINANLEQQAQAFYKSWFVDADTTGWGTKKLADFFNVITGKKDANYSTKDGVYPFFTCSQDILKAPNYSFEGAAILLAGNGDFNVKRYIGKFEAYQRTYVLIPFEKRYHSFLYLLIKYHLQEITGGSRGSVIKFITKGNIADFTFTMPPYSIDEKLSLFDSLFNEIDKNITEINNLSTIRETLLPKLMSGEIKV